MALWEYYRDKLDSKAARVTGNFPVIVLHLSLNKK